MSAEDQEKKGSPTGSEIPSRFTPMEDEVVEETAEEFDEVVADEATQEGEDLADGTSEEVVAEEVEVNAEGSSAEYEASDEITLENEDEDVEATAVFTSPLGTPGEAGQDVAEGDVAEEDATEEEVTGEERTEVFEASMASMPPPPPPPSFDEPARPTPSVPFPSRTESSAPVGPPSGFAPKVPVPPAPGSGLPPSPPAGAPMPMGTPPPAAPTPAAPQAAPVPSQPPGAPTPGQPPVGQPPMGQPPVAPPVGGQPPVSPPPVGQPAPGMPAAAPSTGANPFVLALKNLWYVTADFWKGNDAQAFERPREVTRATGNTAWNWLVPLIAFPLILGFWMMAQIRFMYAGIGGMFGGYAGMFMPDIPAEIYLKTFFSVALFTFGYMMLRAVAILLAQKTSGAKQATFVSAATNLGVAQTIWLLPLAIIGLMGFVLPVIFAPIAMIALSGVMIMAELATYTAVDQTGARKRSMLIPYSWYSLFAFMIFMGIMTVTLGATLMW